MKAITKSIIFGASALALQSCVAAQSSPNVIFILTDDQGYGDIGFTGNEDINTPHIDKLAAESYRLTNYHTATTSAPTRSALMTGNYCNEVGVWHTIQGRSILDPERKIIAEVFKENGYSTAMFGKWHLGDNYPYRPCDRGFDVTLWHKGGGVTQLPDYWLNDYFDDTYFDGITPRKVEGYCTDVFFEEAKQFITKSKNKPFFCYLALNAPHGPFHVEEKYVSQYRDNDNIVNPKFYGMISNIDENVGKLRAFLKKNGLDENTIVIFSTDNGTAGGVKLDGKDGPSAKGYNAGMRGNKGSVYEGGHRVPFVIHIPGEQSKSCDVNDLCGAIDFMPTMLALCNIENNVPCDGVNIMPAIRGEQRLEERFMLVDTQRQEYLSLDRPWSAMKGDWRLVNNAELYNIADDPGQSKNLARKYPEMVKELRAAHAEWWKSNIYANDIMYHIPIAVDGEECVTINCHDCHDPENGDILWLQSMLRKGMRANTNSWAIEVPEDGVYNFELYRWAIEAKLGLTAPAKRGGPIPNGTVYKAGGEITDITGAELRIDGKRVASLTETPLGKRCYKLSGVELKRGKYLMEANFTTRSGKMGAPFVKISR